MKPDQDIKDFISNADPRLLADMIKADTLGNTEEYYKLKAKLLKDYTSNIIKKAAAGQ